MKHLVSGASGFLGSHLVKALSEKGFSVRALYRNTPPPEALQNLPGVEWQRCDLLDVYDVEEALKDVDKVIHCAAGVSFESGDAEMLLHNNRESTANLVNEMIACGIARLIHVSSVAALGRSKEGEVLTEDIMWEESKANSMYARSKYAAEMEAWRGAAEGLSVAIANPGIVLGAPLEKSGWNKGSATLMRTVAKEFPYYTSGRNGWVDVQDVVSAILLLLGSAVEDERFILAQNFSYKEVFTQMAMALGVKPPKMEARPFMSGLVWRWYALKKVLGGKNVITRETARTAQQKVLYSSAKFQNAFPEFEFTSLEETVQQMALAFQQDADNAAR